MAKKMWGGRFNKKTSPLVERFTTSIHYDYKLAEYDVVGSMLHVKVLEKAGILKPIEATKLQGLLKDIFEDIKRSKFKYEPGSEDIHTNIQNILLDKAGDLALKLHTMRSRNEQVVFATKLYCKTAISNLIANISGLEFSISKLAQKNSKIIMPGFTHMQHAQPVYLKDYLGSYIEMLARDVERLKHIDKDMKITMGAGALAGTQIDAVNYNIDIPLCLGEIKKSVGSFDVQVVTNALDAVSDRDFVVEIIAALSILAMHLSRLSEDLIIWSTKEFGFIDIDESYCTGSSLMPQKKNPDVLELVRGYTGRLYGNLVSILTVMKGLPMAYNRDMQLDKEPLFDSFEIILNELKVLSGFFETLKFNKEEIEKHLQDESLYATDLVYYLVEKGVAFKDAHTIVGKLIKHSIDKSVRIKDMSMRELKSFSEKFIKNEIIELFDSKVSLKAKKSIKREPLFYSTNS